MKGNLIAVALLINAQDFFGVLIYLVQIIISSKWAFDNLALNRGKCCMLPIGLNMHNYYPAVIMKMFGLKGKLPKKYYNKKYFF